MLCLGYRRVSLSRSSLLGSSGFRTFLPSSLSQMPPAPSFVKLCAEDGVTLPSSKSDRLAFLNDAGVSFPATIPARDLAERVATLAWAQHSIATDADPDSWSTTLPESLLGRLLSLYPLPLQNSHDGATVSDAQRMATVIALYTPAAPSQALPQAAPPQPPAGKLIDTVCKDGAQGPLPAASSPAGTSLASSLPRQAGKRLMHEELSRVLPPVVYHAFDATSHLTPEKRSKLLHACKNNDPLVLLDGTNTAAFGHHFSLVLTEGDHFDAACRGLALAAAGRSACLSPDAIGSTQALDASRRNSQHQEFRGMWRKIAPAFPLETELSGTMVNQLWAAVIYVMTIRADRSATYGVPKVEADCRRQLAELTAYRAAIAAAVARAADYADHGSGPHPINIAYLNFFLPFWWEHVLLRPRLHDAAAVADQATKILKLSAVLAPAITPPPAPTPALPAPAPTPSPLVYYPPIAPGFHPPQFLPGTFPGFHPLPSPWPPGHQPHAPLPPRSSLPPTCCKPMSPVIVGNNICVNPTRPGRICNCVISTT